MSTDLARLRAAVDRARRDHRDVNLPITTLVQIAREEIGPPHTRGYDFLTALDVDKDVSGEVDGLTVRVKVRDDEVNQLGGDDVTGWFTDTYEEGCVKYDVNGYNGQGYKWYHPCNDTLANTYNELRKRGMSKSVAGERYRAIVQQEMRDDADRYYLGVIVTVSVDGDKLAEASLWGIDVIPRFPPAPYLIDVAADLIDEAMDGALAELPAAIERAQARLARLQALTSEED